MAAVVRFAIFGLLLGVLGAPKSAHSQPTHGQNSASLQKLTRAFPPVSMGCLGFVDASAVKFRKEQWLHAIEKIAATNPEFIHNWIIGAQPAPEAVIAESTRQKDCMIEAMVHSAARPESELVLDWWDRTSKKSEMTRVRDRFVSSPKFRKSLIRQISRSAYRDARTQSWIWKRKFTFRSRAFNRVSPRAAERCGIKSGRTWNPALRDHERCWFRVLTLQEREREILVASSAPGISRHHWGTDFDFFSLNPRNFVEGRRLADEYAWMSKSGHQYGFFQPYRNPTSPHQYMEERWHWSYYPIAQALSEYAAQHEDELEHVLFLQWADMESRWNRKRRQPVTFFDYVRTHWRGFVFNTQSELP